MKLTGAAAVNFFAKPDSSAPGLLICGQDAMRVALRRQEVILALIGPEGESEMRLTRMQGADLRRDHALLLDAIKAQGFFPGPRVAFVEDATDSLAAPIEAALKEWREGDATIIVTASGNIPKTLVKLFEGHRSARSVTLYDDPPSQAEIEAVLKRAGLTQIAPAAMSDLVGLARDLDPGDFRQTVEKISLYKWGDPTPLLPEDVAAMAPSSIEAEVDDVIHATAEGRREAIGPLMRRLEGQGVQPVTICIATLRHFKTLFAGAIDPAGPAVVLGRMRLGPHRDRMIRQAGAWGARRLETALAHIVETDLTLRSTSRAPTMAVMERVLLRLAEIIRRA